MAMDKVIKEFNNGDLTYQLGYNLLKNKVWPCIEIYKDKKLLSGGSWGFRTIGGVFYFFANNSFSDSNGNVGCLLNEMFTWLRKYNEIPEYIEREYEELFILYKLNDFNEN